MPTLPSSHPLRLLHGTLGGILLSIAGFLPWALAGRPLSRALGEAGMYAVCALAFLSLSAPLLHRLLIGPRSLPRFYTLFTAAFIPYSIAWTLGWMALRGHPGSAAGLILGCLAMATVLCTWFRQWRLIPAITLALLVCQVPGYFLGGWAHGALGAFAKSSPTLAIVAKLSWGLFFGAGFGAGLAIALHRLQTKDTTEESH